MERFKTIGCAVDGSKGGAVALALSARLALMLDAKLVLLHVEPEDPGEALLAPPPAPHVHWQRRELDRWALEASELAGEHVELKLSRGDPATEIVSMARQAGCELLVVGTNVTRRLSLAVGSVAAAVLLAATCPVLVARPPPDRSAAGEVTLV